MLMNGDLVEKLLTVTIGELSVDLMHFDSDVITPAVCVGIKTWPGFFSYPN